MRGEVGADLSDVFGAAQRRSGMLITCPYGSLTNLGDFLAFEDCAVARELLGIALAKVPGDEINSVVLDCLYTPQPDYCPT